MGITTMTTVIISIRAEGARHRSDLVRSIRCAPAGVASLSDTLHTDFDIRDSCAILK